MKKIKLTYNLPQVSFALSKHKSTFLEWGRGTGKSTVFGIRLKDCVINMPRAKFAIPGETYKQLLTQTLPSTIKGLEMLGFKKDLHFWVGHKPPAKWKIPEAYEPPLSYESSIIFYNGFTVQLISLETDSGGRGINFDGCLADESGSLDLDRLNNNVINSIRGNEHIFKKVWLHQSKLFAGTTALTLKGRWFSDMYEAALKDPKNILHIRASSFMNAANLGKEYFKTCLRMMTMIQYNAEILCKRPDQVEHSFYPNFSESKHCYDSSNESYLFGLGGNVNELEKNDCRTDNDLRHDIPIEIAGDWGVTINTLSCGQDTYLGNEFKYINAFHVLSPQTIPDLANKFCDYYEYFSLKEVIFHYDHTAVGKSPTGGLTFAAQMTKCLRDRGWTVTERYHGQAPGHQEKFNFWSVAHREAEDSKLPRFRYNKHNCRFLIVSIQQAGAIDGKNGIEKDKKPERRQKQKQEEATHHSDGHDTLGYFKFKHRIGGAIGWVF